MWQKGCMKKVIFMVGVPGSGKSTYAKKKFKKAVILSSDEIRKEIFNEETNESNNALVFNTLYNRAKEIIKTKDIVIDATSSNKHDRALGLQHFKDMKVKRIAVVIDTPLEECLKRNRQRSRVVDEDVIKQYFINFEMPSKEEGFDKIKIVKN